MRATTRRNGRAKRREYSPEKMAQLMDAVEQAGKEGAERYDRIVKKPRKDNRYPVTGRRPRTEHTPERMKYLAECARSVALDSSKRLAEMIKDSTENKKSAPCSAIQRKIGNKKPSM